MHRFRKKSDASTKRGVIGGGSGTGPVGLGIGIDLPDIRPVRSSPAPPPVEFEPLPELPPASNFRTSLILPDLTRRFTLLRTSSGEPLSIDELRNRFAEQRARGAEHSISEEEEDMILETLGRIRGNGNGTQNAHGNGSVRRDDAEDEEESLTSREGGVEPDYLASYERSSVRSSFTPASPSSVRSSPSSRSAKRYSNNLFGAGSGRLRDYNYVRSQRSGGSQRSAFSITPTESSMSIKGNSMYSDHSIRAVTPENDGSQSASVQSSPDMNDKTPVARSAPLNPPGPYEQIVSSPSAAEYRLSKTLPPAALKRASLALEEALKEIEEEIEEEAEDEIVMPRSAPASRSHYSMQGEHSRFSTESAETSSDTRRTSDAYEAGTAISSDKHASDTEVQRSSPVPSYNGRRETMSPTPRLPGYIPGMPRPMTPRDSSFDALSNDQSRSHSTTPRPISPLLPGLNGRSSPLIPASIVAGLMRRESNTAAGSSTYLARSENGNSSFDEPRGSTELTLEDALGSSILERLRPVSPLTSSPFQPMAVSSRPSTPSNITWNTSNASSNSINHSRNESGSGRSRSASVSTAESPAQSKPTVGKSLRSPAPSESPVLDRVQATSMSTPARNQHNIEQFTSENRSPAFELSSPPSATYRILHSPTPTQNRSPVSPSVINELSTTAASASRRASRQNPPSSPFSLEPAHPLVFSPRPNSSRSSIASEGSSYHSDDGSRKKDRDLDLFNDIDSSYATWHDVSSTDKTSSTVHGDSQDEGWDAEDIISRYAGLTKLDFVAIQEKLVGAAIAKAATPDPRERAPSLRRRRPSTSQSNYSLNGRDNRQVASPAPQVQAQVQVQTQVQPQTRTQVQVNVTTVTEPDLAPPNQTHNEHKTEEPAKSSPRQQRDLSPTSRRNRDLAQALFGEHSQAASHRAQSPPTSSVRDKPAQVAYHQPSPSTPTLMERTPVHTRSATEGLAQDASPASPNPTQINRNPSVLRSPQALVNQTELAREVQRKTEAATASLKRGPSAKYHDANASSTSVSFSRKRITPHQISSPHLVSASNSMDTIPLRSPSVASGNMQQQQKPGKLGQRLRKWGTLRSKPSTPNGEEITPFPLDVQPARTPPAVQTARFNASNVNIPEPPATASLTESGRSKLPLPSPPATAGPGLKGFMSRFRKPRATDTSPERDRRSVDQERRTRPEISPTTSSGASSSPLNEYVFPRQSQSAPASKPTFQSPTSPHVILPDPITSAPLSNRNGLPRDNSPQQTEQPEATANDSLALKQLFDAASNLGLDQTALNDLLARSGSTSSRSTAGWTMLTRNNSALTTSRPATRNESAMGRALSPTTSEGSPSTDGLRKEDNAIGNAIPRKRVKPATLSPDGQEGDAGSSTIVRRTIIFPSESRTSTIDVNILMRKNSQSRRRQSASAASVTSSSRSVHDRAPTPPPPRSPTGRRFSHDGSPPVPQLPTSFSAQAESLLPLPTPRTTTASPMEKSSSAYDSLYEMYAGDRATSAGLSDHETSPTSPLDSQGNPELGRGVEVIELANGETIWSIVNGLRDEDAESVYASRNSFASDYSMQPPNGDGVQVVFKEHNRAGSKGSNSSFLSRKRLPTGKNRPETKVFYSSSNQIGRLIENLSEGQEAGSFNFLPNRPAGHTSSPSFGSDTDVHWTVEERLEHMLGSIGAS